MVIRNAEKTDLLLLLELYTQLHENPMPEFDEKLYNIWDDILSDKNHHVMVGTINGQIVSSCIMVVVPNLTHNQRPYALIENVVTDVRHRNRGYASQLLCYARDIALKENCYKIMLLTGSKNESTLRFYEKAGYNRNDKTAFVQWLD